MRTVCLSEEQVLLAESVYHLIANLEQLAAVVLDADGLGMTGVSATWRPTIKATG